MTHKAKKVVIITEKVIFEKVAKLIEKCGGTGYTVSPAGGKGARGIRANERTGVSDSFVNVKIEIITSSEQVAHDIIDQMAERFFENYSGITYMEDVEILRPGKF